MEDRPAGEYPGVDLHSEEFNADPYPVLAELRRECPVAHSGQFGGLNVVTRYDDVSAVAHEPEAFSSRRVAPNDVPTDRPGLVLPPVNLDPPEHQARRTMLLPFFSPRSVASWEAYIGDVCDALLQRLEGRDTADAAVEYAQEIPADVTARLLGVPADHAPQFRAWIHDLLEVGPADLALAKATTAALLAYTEDLTAKRRAEPRSDDLVSYLLDQEIDGAPLADEEVSRILVLMVIAGIDTTWSSIGAGLLHFATNRVDRERLVAEPALMDRAVEEVLRLYSPVWAARIADEDRTVGGCPIEAGEWAVLHYPSANRDEDAFDHAGEFVIDRSQNRHTAFGVGIHRCLGSNLARLEMKIAFQRWLERFPGYHLAPGAEVQYSSGQIRGPRKIPVLLR